MIKIRKGKKLDFKEYLKLIRKQDKEYSKMIGEKSVYPPQKELRKQFNKILSSRKDLLLVVEKDKELIGYMYGKFFKALYNKGGYVEDIFVLKEFRNKGVGTSLIKEFTKAMKKKKLKNLHLGVSIKNINAIKFYKELGFKIYHYDMKKKLK